MPTMTITDATSELLNSGTAVEGVWHPFSGAATLAHLSILYFRMVLLFSMPQPHPALIAYMLVSLLI